MESRTRKSIYFVASFILLLLCSILLFTNRVVTAQTSDEPKSTSFTSSLANGRFWVQMNTDQKAVWLHGYQDGLKVAAAYAYMSEHSKTEDLEQKILDAQIGKPLVTTYEWVKGIDSFYDDVTNLPVPIAAVIDYVRKKANGATPAQLEELAAGLRKTSSQ